jgi:hypothetical protein
MALSNAAKTRFGNGRHDRRLSRHYSGRPWRARVNECHLANVQAGASRCDCALLDYDVDCASQDKVKVVVGSLFEDQGLAGRELA